MAFQKSKTLQEAEKCVAQGKIAQAIRLYQLIIDNDSSDVSLLNTVGDLYVRDGNVGEALKQFHRLAEAYIRNGFNVRAIAIYKKISKVDSGSGDTLLKLAELYQLQGLTREAREQYLQVAELFRKRNQAERVFDVLRKLVQLDPENVNFRNRLAEECEQTGKWQQAAQAYLESAEILIRRDGQIGADTALKKAVKLDPENSKAQILRARVALARNQPEEAERIINSSPTLQADPASKRILLDSYLGAGKLPEAAKLALEFFQASPPDFAPVASVSARLAQKGEIEEAYQLLASVAEPMISQNNGPPLLEALRVVWDKSPAHIPTLELVHSVCERTADESTLPVVLEALGRAYEGLEDLAKAEDAYQKLVDREPENENYQALLNAIRQRQGRTPDRLDFSAREMALTEEDLVAEAPSVDAAQEASVNEALENSDLFARYNLIEKANSELEKVLKVYPDRIDVHQRILEISSRSFPQRGAEAATQLARIFTERGDLEAASKYQAIASTIGATPEVPVPPPAPANNTQETATVQPGASEGPATGVIAEDAASGAGTVDQVDAAPAVPSGELAFEPAPLDVSSEPPTAPAPALAEQSAELDLSADLEIMEANGFHAPDPSVPEAGAPPLMELPVTAEIPSSDEAAAPPPVVEETLPPAEVPIPPPEEAALLPADGPLEVVNTPPTTRAEAVPADLEETKIEVEFYIENGFLDEAWRAVALIEEKYPASALVAELRQRLNEGPAEVPSPETNVQVAPTDALAGALPVESEVPDEASVIEPTVELVAAEPQVGPPLEITQPAPEPAPDEQEVPTGQAVPPQPEPEIDAVFPASVSESAVLPEVETTPLPTPESVPEPAAMESGGMHMLGDLAGDFASMLEGLAAPTHVPQAPTTPAPAATSRVIGGSSEGAAQLRGLLAEIDESDGAVQAAGDDPETHYNLGVAFREMGLLDEAIGEFQKVVRIVGKGSFPPSFLQACSLLATCFMEKQMPAIAVKWYQRALESPGLEEEAHMALQYDLGLAYEQAGDSQHALERFTDVYSQDIDFRDVAEKVRNLRQKA